MDSIYYPHSPINSLKALNKALKIDEAIMRNALNNIRYTELLLTKKDGTTRIVYDASPALKVIQKRITTQIFHKIVFPGYIHGCIRDRETPRSIYTNASPHAGKKQIILCDIKNFFPTITEDKVKTVFRELLGFSPIVSERLTTLCTLNSALPQGASTSSYIANLIFWDVEPELVRKLKINNLTYTRFVDDITISSDKIISKEQKTQVLSSIRNTIRKKGCTLKKRKTMVLKRGQSIIEKGNKKQHITRKPVTVTGLSVHHDRVTISKQERRNIRAAVHRLEKTDARMVSYQTWNTNYASAMGKVSRLISCGHKEGEVLKQRLKALKSSHKVFH
ncbi:RNA-directed DNA polymerase [Cobetia amphilecti]|nr:RNA-directed DNA polymerase [Cobetia litoralis]